MTLSLTFQAAPWPEGDEIQMGLTLTYKGPLLACGNSTRSREKQELRWCFSKLLERHWKHDSYLRIEAIRPGVVSQGRFLRPADESGRGRRLSITFGQTEYVPLISTELSMFCDLEIDWLRPEDLGGIIKGADLDGGLKTLFDALRMPHSIEEAVEVPHGEASRCYCLLEDDALIRNLTIKSRKLLEEAGKNDVQLMINATIVTAGWDDYLDLNPS